MSPSMNYGRNTKRQHKCFHRFYLRLFRPNRLCLHVVRKCCTLGRGSVSHPCHLQRDRDENNIISSGAIFSDGTKKVSHAFYFRDVSKRRAQVRWRRTPLAAQPHMHRHTYTCTAVGFVVVVVAIAVDATTQKALRVDFVECKQYLSLVMAIPMPFIFA